MTAGIALEAKPREKERSPPRGKPDSWSPTAIRMGPWRARTTTRPLPKTAERCDSTSNPGRRRHRLPPDLWNWGRVQAPEHRRFAWRRSRGTQEAEDREAPRPEAGHG